MHGFVERKMTGGKLVKARVEFEATIAQARFFGDFFLHPEETIHAIEAALVGLPAHTSLHELETTIASVLEQQKAELIGASPRDFATLVSEAIQIGSK